MTGSYEAEFAWIPVLVVVGLVAIGIAAFIIADRRRRAPLALDDAVVAEEVANALEDSLDDLRAEPDPRRAVIADVRPPRAGSRRIGAPAPAGRRRRTST